MSRSHQPLHLFCIVLIALSAALMLSSCGDNTSDPEGTTAAEHPEGQPPSQAPILDGPQPTTQASTVFFLAADASVSHQASQILLLQSLARASSGLTLQIADARGNTATQATQLQQAASAKAAAIIIQPVNALDLASDMQQAKAGGALILSLDAQSPNTACDAILFANQETLGKKAGELIVGALTQKAKDEGQTTVSGRVVELRGTDESPSCTARDRGLNAALAAEPGVILVHDAPTHWNPKDTLDRFQEALRLQKNFDVIYAHDDIIAQAAAEAAVAAGIRENVFIVGTDGLGGEGLGIEALRNHHIDATFYQPYLVDLAWRIVERHQADPNFKPKPRYEFQTMLITPGTLDDLQRKGYPAAPAL
ncbi:MAG: substrate-binding domain-containing protein [Verrucomicrobiaceae bacterium]|nr:substrate-binding domain-containing protein [Verrucomicrobiaceae bacterium]